MATYDPTETIKIKVIKPEIGDYREIDVMPNELDVVKNAFIQQGYQVGEIASEKTSTLGAFGGGILQGASLNLEEEIYGVLGGDEVQKEAEKQRKREERERPVARMAGEVVGSIIGAPAKVAGMTAKAASKLGPMAARGLGALTGAAEGAVSGIASKPMGEKDKLSAVDVIAPVLGAAGGAAFTKGKKVYRGTRSDKMLSVKPERKEAGEPSVIYFTDNPNVAETYAGRQGHIHQAELSMENPLVIDAQGKGFKEIPIDTEQGTVLMKTDKAADWAKKQGYDGVIIKNVLDPGGKPTTTPFSEEQLLGTNYIIFNKEKVIDPQTFTVKTRKELQDAGLEPVSLLGKGSQNKVYKTKTPEGREFAVKWGSRDEDITGWANLSSKEIGNRRKLRNRGWGADLPAIGIDAGHRHYLRSMS